MFNLRRLAQARAWATGCPWAVVRRGHGLSVMSLRLASAARSVEILEVAR